MMNNNRITSFEVTNRNRFRQYLNRPEARQICDWDFDSYDFSKEDVALIHRLKCQSLMLWEIQHNDESNVHSLQQDVLFAFLTRDHVEKLTINTAVQNSFFKSSDLYWFVYRAPISQSLKEVHLTLLGDVKPSLAKALSHASSITDLGISSIGDWEARHMHQFFRSTSLKRITFSFASPKDCFALMRRKTNENLEKVTVWGVCVKQSEVMSKNVSSVLLKEPTITHVFGILSSSLRTNLPKYQIHVFKETSVCFTW